MLKEQIGDATVYVVGNHYAIEDKLYPRISASYAGEEYSDFLQEAFTKNTNEDYDALTNHSDPTVRLLVMENVEGFDALLDDPVERIATRARLLQALHNPLTGDFALTPATVGF